MSWLALELQEPLVQLVPQRQVLPVLEPQLEARLEVPALLLVLQELKFQPLGLQSLARPSSVQSYQH